jgi:hypothetical protein
MEVLSSAIGTNPARIGSVCIHQPIPRVPANSKQQVKTYQKVSILGSTKRIQLVTVPVCLREYTSAWDQMENPTGPTIPKNSSGTVYRRVYKGVSMGSSRTEVGPMSHALYRWALTVIISCLRAIIIAIDVWSTTKNSKISCARLAIIKHSTLSS